MVGGDLDLADLTGRPCSMRSVGALTAADQCLIQSLPFAFVVATI